MASRLFLVPPGGFIGAQQQTQAGQVALMGGRGGGGGGARRRRRRSASSTRKRARKSSRRVSSRRARSRKSSRRMRLVKGSAAAKRYMAKLRRVRERCGAWFVRPGRPGAGSRAGGARLSVVRSPASERGRRAS